jgi:hypothetical protein
MGAAATPRSHLCSLGLRRQRWTGSTRDRDANDLVDRRTLAAVSASSSRSKSDRDPAEWMPDLAGCKYLAQWVAVKIRWQLRVDTTEKHFLTAEAADCPTPSSPSGKQPFTSGVDTRQGPRTDHRVAEQACPSRRKIRRPNSPSSANEACPWP